MPASTAIGNAILNCWLRGTAPTVPTGLFISLHTGNPGATGSSNEVSTGAWPAYARQNAAGGGAISGAFSAAANKVSTNAHALLYPANNGASPITVTHFAIWSAVTGGNCHFTGQLAASKTLDPTDELTLPVGSLSVTVD